MTPLGRFGPLEVALVLIAALAAANLAALYLMALGRWRGSRSRPPAWRSIAFVTGLGTAVAACALELSGAAASVSTHVFHHTLLGFVAPPLLLLGYPAVVALRGTPPGVARLVLGRPRAGPLELVGRYALHPAVALAGFNLALFLWQHPSLYEAAMRSEAVHVGQHAFWFLAGLLFWWYIVGSGIGPPRLRLGLRVGYVMVGALIAGLPGVLLMLTTTIVYRSHVTTTSPLGLSPLNDQVMAGALLLFVSKASLALAFIVMFFRLVAGGRWGPGEPARRPRPSPPSMPSAPDPRPRQPAGAR